jgi:hypothetical protein
MDLPFELAALGRVRSKGIRVVSQFEFLAYVSRGYAEQLEC